jgi:hypothetical protein
MQSIPFLAKHSLSCKAFPFQEFPRISFPLSVSLCGEVQTKLSNLFIFSLRRKIMAVPKKRTSKSKKNTRKSVWKNQAKKEAIKALSIAKYVVGLDLMKNNLIENKDTTSTINSGFSE